MAKKGLNPSSDFAASQGSRPRASSAPWLWLSLAGLLGLAAYHYFIQPQNYLNEEVAEQAQYVGRIQDHLKAQAKNPKADLGKAQKDLQEAQEQLQAAQERAHAYGRTSTMAWIVLGLFALAALRSWFKHGLRSPLRASPWPGIWAIQSLILALSLVFSGALRTQMLSAWVWLGALLLLPPFMKLRLPQALALASLLSAAAAARWDAPLTLAFTLSLGALSAMKQALWPGDPRQAGMLLHKLLVLPWRWVTLPLGAQTLDHDSSGWHVNRSRLASLFRVNLALGVASLAWIAFGLARLARWGQDDSYLKMGLWIAAALALLSAYGILARRGYSSGPLKARALGALLKAAPLALAGLVLGVYLASLALDLAGRRALKKVRAKHIEAGFSLDLPNEPALVPTDKNAAPLLLKAVTEYGKVTASAKAAQKNDDSKAVSQFLREAEDLGLAAKASPALREVLRKHAPALAAWRAAAERPGLNWGTRFGPPWISMPIPQYSPHLELSRMLAAQAVLEAQQGRLREAQADLAAISSIATLFSRDGLIIGQMFSIALRTRVFLAAPALFQSPSMPARAQAWLPVPGSASEAKRLLEAISREMATYPLDLEAVADRLWAPWKSGPSLQELYGTRNAWLYLPFLRLDLASAMRLQSAQLAALQKDPRQSLAALEAATQKEKACSWPLAGQMLPNYFGMHVKSLKADAQSRLLELAFRAREYKRDKGRWPEAAWQLARSSNDETAQELFKAGWMRLLPWGQGIMIYSVGPDGQDDQGAPIKVIDGSEHGDIAIRLL